MAGNHRKKFEPRFNGELNIESIISAPLVAVSKANAMILDGQTKFLLSNCFDVVGGVYKPKMVEMLLTRSAIDPDKKPADPGYIAVNYLIFQVPLLCLLPLTSLAVDKVNIGFDMEIVSTGSYVPASPDSDTLQTASLIQRKAVLNGKIASANQPDKKSNRYENRTSSQLKVNIQANRLPLPTGVLTIIDLYTKSIQPVPQQFKKDN
jgi:hypothetical protein